MGYNTNFRITIHASTKRQQELAKVLVHVAKVDATEKEEALKRFEEQGVLSFTSKWPSWERDVKGWNDCLHAKNGNTDMALLLEEGELFEIEGFGDDDNDIWQSVVTKRMFFIKRCLRVEFVNKRPCEKWSDNNGTRVQCTGCQSCADRLPIY